MALGSHPYERAHYSLRRDLLGIFVMTDIPDDPGHNISPLDAQRMREFFGVYGSFLQLWQTFELVIEIAIMRRLSLSTRHASIVLNSLNFSAKSSILLALLREAEQENKEAISAITSAHTQAERNDFTHCFLTTSDAGLMQLVRRNIRNGHYSVNLRDVNATAMRDHGFQFAEAAEKAMKALRITSADVDEYSREIESHA
jgi:hypothetical protein